MVDPEPDDLPLADEPQDEPVRLVEDAFVLHPDGGEAVDVEEAAVVDLLSRHAPVRQAIGLRVEEAVEQIEASRVSRSAVEEGDVLIEVLPDARGRVTQDVQAALR